jgi:hypothetical protein
MRVIANITPRHFAMHKNKRGAFELEPFRDEDFMIARVAPETSGDALEPFIQQWIEEGREEAMKQLPSGRATGHTHLSIVIGALDKTKRRFILDLWVTFIAGQPQLEPHLIVCDEGKVEATQTRLSQIWTESIERDENPFRSNPGTERN